MVKERKEDRPFAGTEVAALVESFRQDISVIAEDVKSLRNDVNVLKIDVGSLKNDLTIVKDAIRIAIPDIYSRLTALESRAS